MPEMIPLYEAADVYERFKQLRKEGKLVKDCYTIIAEEWGKNEHAIKRLLSRFRPRTQLATAYLQASALRMARRVVKEADPGHLIDVLSRPNMGVLAPKQEQSNVGQGFFLTVASDSCGAVKIGAGMAQLPAANPTSPEGENDGTSLFAEDERRPPRRVFGRRSEAIIESARARIEAAKSQRADAQRRGDRSIVVGSSALKGLQDPDGDLGESVAQDAEVLDV